MYDHHLSVTLETCNGTGHGGHEIESKVRLCKNGDSM